MNLEEIKKFFEEQKDNEDVKSYLQGLSQVTPDGVQTFLDSEDGKKLLQPRLDSYFTKGLETWKSNNLKKLVDEEVKKQNPPTNPLEKQLEDLKRELLLKDLKAKAKDVASENKLPLKIVDYFVGNDEESTIANLKTLQEVFDTHINERVQEQLKSGGINPAQGTTPPTITREQLKGMTAEEIQKLDPKIVNEALKN
ncbi:DUF4355 domain-containing protein [Neobacillus cucumis]|uniref:DUF4355 domain-containing protein n=1 Tax=Neobacillus cucumis TaxID=1740721 RepID=A0A2N5HEU5_9BACI|nr:DUF4355 domain-containing protein [Neobacillus cucumis]PLS04027.1 hypothetical protein CVD27_12770 [Neobacillus cucumis]